MVDGQENAAVELCSVAGEGLIKSRLIAMRMMTGRRKRRILAIIAFACLVMLSFGQNQNGMKNGTSGAPKGLPAGLILGTNGTQGVAVRQAKSVVFVQDLPGVDCTGAADSGEALNALTGNAPKTNNAITGRTLSFGNCPSIKLSKTWVIYNQAGFIIDGLTRSGSAGKGVNISWSGAANGVMIDMEYVNGFQVQGLNIQGNSSAGVGIQIDKNGSGGIWNTTDGRFINNTFTGAATNWIGISLSPVSANNVEDMRVENSTFYCNAPASTTAAVGIVIGPSANTKNEIFEHNEFTQCYYAVWQRGGSMQIRDSEFEISGGTCGSGTGAALRIDGNSDPDLIQGNLDEGSVQGINQNNDSGAGMAFPVIVRGNHNGMEGCENLNVYYYNTGSGAVPWIFDGNGWDADSTITRVIGTNQSGSQTQIYTRGNLYPNATFVPWWLQYSGGQTDEAGVWSNSRMFSENVQSGVFPQAGYNAPSPFAVFRGYLNGCCTTPDDFALQEIPGSSTNHGSTFLIKHQQGTTGTSMFAFDGSYPGLNVAQLATPGSPDVGAIGTTGSTSYTYSVVAYYGSFNTPGSATSTFTNGNATLSSNNYNLIQFNPVAGATKYCVWLTATTGSSNLGNIGCTSAIQGVPGGSLGSLAFGSGYPNNFLSSVGSYYQMSHTSNIAGDSSSLPSSNTTGVIVSTVPTGTAPLSVASTTPVANLSIGGNAATATTATNCTNCSGVYEAGVLTTDKIYTNTQALSTGAATHTFANSFTYTSSSTFGCTCTDQTAANACQAVPTAASAVNLAGTGSDVLWLECLGH